MKDLSRSKINCAYEIKKIEPVAKNEKLHSSYSILLKSKNVKNIKQVKS